MNKLKNLLTSRKFLAAVATIVVMTLRELGFNISEETTIGVLAIASAFIVGTGLEDGLSKRPTSVTVIEKSTNGSANGTHQ